MKLITKVIAIFVMVIFFSTAFVSCGQTTSMGLSYKSNNDGTCIVSGIGRCVDTVIVVPRKNEKGEKVVAIGSKAFKSVTGLTSVTLPDSITKIYDNAFADNGSLISINIPSSVVLIDRAAFKNCTSLSKVDLQAEFKYAEFEVVENSDEKEIILGSEQLIDDMGEEIVFLNDENREEIYKMVFGNAKLHYK